MPSDHWIRVRFRDDEVLARCDAAGAFALDGAFVPIRYKPGGKVYKTRPDRLVAVAGALPEAAERTVEAKPKRPSGSARAASASTTWRSEEEAVQLWTDGACTGNPGPAGSGVHLRHRGRVEEVSEYLGVATNNIAELTAILRGLEMVDDPTWPVDVMSDSSYCIGLLTKGWKPKANQELVAALRETAARFSDLRFVKVRGHVGVPGNERADELAREAISQGLRRT